MKDSLHSFAQKSFAYSGKSESSDYQNIKFRIHIKQKEYLLTSIVLSLSLSQYQLTIISINLSLIKFPPTGNHSRIPNITSSKCSRISNKSYKTII
jgi:hypothetical protein